MTQKIKTLIIFTALLLLCTIGYAKHFASAAPCLNSTTDSSCHCGDTGCDNGLPVKNAIDCPSGKVDQTDTSKCAPLGNDCNGLTSSQCLKNNPITSNLNDAVNFLSAGVGIVVIGVIILGGIQYTLAGDNATATKAARQRIINGLIALFAFLFTYAFLQWIIPGGL